jgi:hypothetical protein
MKKTKSKRGDSKKERRKEQTFFDEVWPIFKESLNQRKKENSERTNKKFGLGKSNVKIIPGVKEGGESGSFAHTRPISGWILQHHFSGSLATCSRRLLLLAW